MSMIQRTSTPQMPFEFGVPIDPVFRKTLQAKIRTLLQAKTEGFPGSYPVAFEQSHLQQLVNEEYFVLEKVAGVRYMLLSTITPKGPACFLIDRHFEISFVPHLLLPQRDSPGKCQNETLLDGEMVVESDGNKKSLRFLVFDLMVLNGSVVTQRSYSTRLGMMDQDVLAMQASKPSDVKAKEPFTIERKTMQRSYGLNIILSGSKRHKHGGEGLIFVPVKQPYLPGTNLKLFKWKSHTTAQFQIKVTLSRERKPLYCIHVKQGGGSKFYDYVTPEPALASEWHTTSPDGKVAEFWWDAQWPTQMFEKGYGLETRTGGWRFYRVREDKKEIDEEATVLGLVRALETLVTKQQLESQIEQIRTQWKAREAGTSSNGSISQSSQSSQPSQPSQPSHHSQSAQRPPVRPISIINNHADNHPSLMTPSLSSHYLQSPSVATHSGALGYFSRKDRERKASVDDYSSPTLHSATSTGTFSHPLPPKPVPFQSRQSSMDQTQAQSAAVAAAVNSSSSNSKSVDQEHGSSPSSTSSSTTSVNPASERKSTPPPSTTSTATASTPSSSSAPPTSVTSPPSTAVTKNPLRLSQVPAHLQPVKSWMTVSPVPRAPLGDRGVKSIRSERRDSRESILGSTSPRSVASSSRKSSMSVTDNTKETSMSAASAAVATKGDTLNATEATPTASASASTQNALSTPQADHPQTPTPAHTPTPAGMTRPTVTPALPPTLSLPPTNIVLPNIAWSPEIKTMDKRERDTDPSIPEEEEEQKPLAATASDATHSDSDGLSVLGKRTAGSPLSAEDRSEDTFPQRRKLSDSIQYSPKAEPPVASVKIWDAGTSRSPAPITSSPLSTSSMQDRDQPIPQRSPLLSPLGSPRAAAIRPGDVQRSLHLSHSATFRAATHSKLSAEISEHKDSIASDEAGNAIKEEGLDVGTESTLSQLEQERVKLESVSETATTVQSEDVDMPDAVTDSKATTDSISTPALTTAEQIAYQPPSDLDKVQALAKARVEATCKMEKQVEEQASKAEKMQEDIERFKEKSRMRKDKAEKWKLQEASEPPVQDRRAQPVRLINQQQGRQLNSDAPVLRGQSQGAQRQVSSPQDQQRLVYSTRQSKAASRTEAQQSAQNSPKAQPRAAQFPSQQQEQTQPSGEQPGYRAASQREQRSSIRESNSPNPARSEQQAAEMPNQMPNQMLQPEDGSRNHRRINSMDHQLQASQSLDSLHPDQHVSDQRELAERLYGQPYSKRLDLGQLAEQNHRRSHSDVGVPYKPVAVNIPQPQPTGREQQQGQRMHDGPPAQQNPPGGPDLDYRQEGYPPQTAGTPTIYRSDADSPGIRNSDLFSSSVKEPAPVARVSKARLQFILNDDDPSPDSPDEDEENYGRRQSPEAVPWTQRQPGHDEGRRMNAPPVEYDAHPPYPHDYGVPEHQGGRVSQSLPTTVVDPSSAARRQAAKRLKLSQDMSAMEQQYGGRTEEYEFHMRQSQMQSLPPRSVAHPPQRTMPPSDRWPQQGPGQQPPQPSQPPQPNQGTPVLGRRVPVEVHGGPPPPSAQQQAVHPNARSMYPGQEQPLPSHQLQHPSVITRAMHGQEHFPGQGPVSPMEGARAPSERPTHSRHSSLSKSGIPLEQIHPPASTYQGPRGKSSQQMHGQQPDPYGRMCRAEEASHHLSSSSSFHRRSHHSPSTILSNNSSSNSKRLQVRARERRFLQLQQSIMEKDIAMAKALQDTRPDRIILSTCMHSSNNSSSSNSSKYSNSKCYVNNCSTSNTSTCGIRRHLIATWIRNHRMMLSLQLGITSTDRRPRTFEAITTKFRRMALRSTTSWNLMLPALDPVGRPCTARNRCTRPLHRRGNHLHNKHRLLLLTLRRARRMIRPTVTILEMAVVCGRLLGRSMLEERVLEDVAGSDLWVEGRWVICHQSIQDRFTLHRDSMDNLHPSMDNSLHLSMDSLHLSMGSSSSSSLRVISDTGAPLFIIHSSNSIRHSRR
ncbi:Dcp1p-Dcp2p decapping enzyme complex alpha subunit [Dissophora globulifera]|uniref:Dcp1p-Dcp2p decapping enzyme complex alpha subunit n=1 Tax=Dissophora globulifera TaxID=979702 RepID=A0A9P6RSH1_9FUNG|nr:Dcp1p-Dcp2p decapping enzyme complex alpha subunit [Dissophora globulifera]